MTRVRATVAAAGAVLLLLTGCDQAEPAEEPAGQAESTEETSDRDAGGEPAEDDTRSGSGTGGEGEDEPDDATADPGGDAPAGDSGDGELPAGPDAEDPCADLTADDVAGVLGSPVKDRSETHTPDPDTAPPAAAEDLVMCYYAQTDSADPGASLFWRWLLGEYPDSMPEDMRSEQAAQQAQDIVAQHAAEGEEVDVEGADAATVRIIEESGVVQVMVSAACGPYVLHSALLGPTGTLDESDVPTAVELAELAIAKA